MSVISTTIAKTPEPPYYAVIFTSQRTEGERGYGEMAERMMQTAARQPGFLGAESARGGDGFGITVSYWSSEEAITAWKEHFEHKPAQEAGKRVWYAEYQLRVAKVERAYGKDLGRGKGPRLTIRIDDLRGPEIRELLTEHLRALARLSPPGSMHALDLEELRKPEITFWSVWAGEELAGCGAVKELDHRHGEIKSMRTAAAHLRKGVAALVLTEIMAEASRRGYRRLSLETGAAQDFSAAHCLYRKFGFSECRHFGDYVEDANSLFMTKEVGTEP